MANDHKQYQDDWDTDDEQSDIITHELTDSPQDSLTTPNKELQPDLDKMGDKNVSPEDQEDFREHVEDMDENDKPH